METNGSESARWYLVVKPDQRALYDVLRARLDGSGVEVLFERRQRERRRGSFGPAMERRAADRRRQRPVAVLSAAAVTVSGTVAAPVAPPSPAVRRSAAMAVTHTCPTCTASLELDLPRFPHPPARVEMEVAHVTGNGRDGQHYAEIAAFTVSGRLILSQRIPARRPA